ncbi:DEAD/DEAH box helicase [Microvirga massiliensis]|uniref:DEAD/DEAH box helicase n=1 Tax=Microvirga massiliensis TaxID=1033741 RepID=UPI000AEB5128|nr:DEAD/DEAH box helicase family protein [Microvirga massiliensis]
MISESENHRTVGDKVAEPYQARIMVSLRDAIRRGRSGAVLAPTGSGKSLLAAAGAEDAVEIGKPILVLHPDVSLLRQNYAQFEAVPALRDARTAFYVAKTEVIGDGEMARNTLDADLIPATNMSLVNKLEDEEFLRGLDEFGRRGGVALIDEGHKAAAEQLSAVLERIARAGGSGIVLTATPFRTDGKDPLDPFGASIEHDLIDVATYDEVLATGRTVPTRFDLATGEFEAHLGAEAVGLIESAFLALLAENKSVDQASQQAFSRFFKADASEGDQAIADLIVTALVRIWAKRAVKAVLAMIHCDSVEFAKALSQALSEQRMPKGHKRAGDFPRVAFVVAGEIRVWRNSEETGLAEGEPAGRKIKRDDLLDAARAGAFDILVNVNALGVGTDVPQTDLNILACQERSIGPVKQISGRGERAHRPTGKTHQVFVDVGNSILRIFNDIDAMRRNDPERSRRQVRGLAAPIREQFEAWFDKDPSLRAQIEQRQREIRLRLGESDSEQYDDPLDSTMAWGDEDTLPVPKPFAAGLLAAGMRRYDSETRRFSSRLALFCDLYQAGLYGPEALPDLPRWLVATHDERLNVQQAFVCQSLDVARKYAAFVGIRYDDEYENTPPSERQRRFLRSLQQEKPQAQPWLEPFAEPESATQISAGIDLLKNRASLLATMLAAGATRLIERATGAHGLQPTIRSVVLDRPNQLTPQRRELLAAYCRLRHRLGEIAPHAFGRRAAPFSITTYDPSVLPEVRNIVAATDIGFFVIEDAEKEEALKPRLAEGLMSSSIVAVGPKGPSDAWIRQKAGFARHDDAAHARESSFRTLLSELRDSDSEDGMIAITLTRLEYREIASAKPGRELTRAIADMARELIALLSADGTMPADGDQVETIRSGIETNAPEIAVSFPIGRLRARFAQQIVPNQKRILKSLEKAAAFKKNREAYLQAAQQAPERNAGAGQSFSPA